MLTDVRRLVRNICRLYRPKTLAKALAEYDQAVSDSDPRDTPSDIFIATDMSFAEFEAVQEVANSDRRCAQVALGSYNKHRSVKGRVPDPRTDPMYQAVWSILERWANEEAAEPAVITRVA